MNYEQEILNIIGDEQFEGNRDEIVKQAAAQLEADYMESGIEKLAIAQTSPGAHTFWGNLKNNLTENRKDSMSAEDKAYLSAGDAAGKAVVGIGAGAAALALGKVVKAIGNRMDRSAYERTLKTVIDRNPILQSADYEKVKGFGDTIFSFAPNVAKDPNALGNVLSHSIHGESMDIETIRSLADLEKRYSDSNPSIAGGLLR